MKNKFTSLHKSLFLLNLFSLVLACTTSQPTSLEVVSSADFEALIRNQKNTLVLDVRTPAEFNAGHISNAEILDFKQADFKSKLMQYKSQDTILVYCRSGNRSHQAAKLMQEIGISKIYELDGGYLAWKANQKKLKSVE